MHKQDMDLSLRASAAASGLADAEVMEQNLQEWIIHRCVRACVIPTKKESGPHLQIYIHIH